MGKGEMSTLELEPNSGHGQHRMRIAPRLRRPLLLLCVTLLCCVTYLEGIWVGSSGRITCVTSEQGTMVCRSGDQPPAPGNPANLPQGSGSA